MFVEGAAPEETVIVEVQEVRKKLLKARVLEVEAAGSSRVDPACTVFGVCGGCALQHIDYAEQARLKHRAVLDTMARLGGIDLARVCVEDGWFSHAYGVRARVRWWAQTSSVGYRARKSHALVVAPDCPILEQPLQEALRRMPSELQPDPAPATGEDIWGVTDGAQVLFHRRHASSRAAAGRGAGSLPWGDAESAVAVRDREGIRWVSVGGFGQAHLAGNDAMLEAMDDWLPDLSVAADLYAGSGNWTRLLARRMPERLVAVEHNRGALALIRRVLPEVELWPEPVERAVFRLERWASKRPLVAVVNPPRTGLAEPVCEGLIECRPRWLGYVSCNAATLARDARRLMEGGMRLRRLRTFDLYPQTPHMEVAACFEWG